jgi:hypothetical protein
MLHPAPVLTSIRRLAHNIDGKKAHVRHTHLVYLHFDYSFALSTMDREQAPLEKISALEASTPSPPTHLSETKPAAPPAAVAPAYPSGLLHAILIVALLLAMFLVALDMVCRYHPALPPPFPC